MITGIVSVSPILAQRLGLLQDQIHGSSFKVGRI